MVLCMVMVFTSCMTPQKVLYLQDMSDSSAVELENNYEARIAPSDRLGIFVNSSADEDLVKMFNQNRTQ